MSSDVNICAGGRSARLRMAVGALIVVIAAVVAMEEAALAPAWRALIALPLAFASFQIVQAYTGVCCVHARNGTRATGGETEPMLDRRQRERMAARGRAVFGVALGLTTIGTALLVGFASI